jgi:hypothetical protein
LARGRARHATPARQLKRRFKLVAAYRNAFNPLNLRIARAALILSRRREVPVSRDSTYESLLAYSLFAEQKRIGENNYADKTGWREIIRRALR